MWVKRAEGHIVVTQERLDSLQRKRTLEDCEQHGSKELTAKKRKKLNRQRSSSRLRKENFEQFEVPQAKRSASRGKQETLEAFGELHGATDTDQSPAFDGMWATLINASSPLRLASYISHSAKPKRRCYLL